MALGPEGPTRPSPDRPNICVHLYLFTDSPGFSGKIPSR
jgi:hypothetical protein